MGEGASHKSHAITSSEIFEKELFTGPRYCKIEDQKPWPGFSRNQDFAEGRGLRPKVKMSASGEALSKLVQLKRITDRGLGAKLPAAGQFFVNF